MVLAHISPCLARIRVNMGHQSMRKKSPCSNNPYYPVFQMAHRKIGEALSILEKGGWVTYFVGGNNYFSHPSGDVRGRRFALSSLMQNSHVRARDLSER